MIVPPEIPQLTIESHYRMPGKYIDPHYIGRFLATMIQMLISKEGGETVLTSGNYIYTCIRPRYLF